MAFTGSWSIGGVSVVDRAGVVPARFTGYGIVPGEGTPHWRRPMVAPVMMIATVTTPR